MKITLTTFASLFFLVIYASSTVLPEPAIEDGAHMNRTKEYVCNYNSYPTQLLRAYNGRSVDHFYTIDAGEMQNAVQNLGYTAEGYTGYILPIQEYNTIPLYRMYSPGGTDHFYTTNVAERDHAAASFGYNNEGTIGFVYPSQTCGAQPLYRLFSGGGSDHFYTMSAFERDYAVAHYGYTYEGIAGYILPI